MKKPEKAYVLTIPRLKDRRIKFLENWLDTGLEIEFFYGLDYKDYNIELNNIYLYRNVPHLFIGGSFYNLMSKLLATDKEEWFICEDDATPTFYWHTFNWESISTLDADMLKLYSYELVISNAQHTANILNLKPSGAWIGACAFVITRTGIQKLFERPCFCPFDYLTGTELDWRCTYPNLVIPTAPYSSYDIDNPPS